MDFILEIFIFVKKFIIIIYSFIYFYIFKFCVERVSTGPKSIMTFRRGFYEKRTHPDSNPTPPKTKIGYPENSGIHNFGVYQGVIGTRTGPHQIGQAKIETKNSLRGLTTQILGYRRKS
jgi:hypothetical protein